MMPTSEIEVYAVASGDSVISKGKEMVQVLVAATNQYDEHINIAICLTVGVVCLFVCAAVVACFIVVSRIKRHAKETDLQLEMKKLEKNREVWKLEHDKHLADQDRKLKKEQWEIEKEIEQRVREKMEAMSKDKQSQSSDANDKDKS